MDPIRRVASPSSTALLTRYPGRIGSHTQKRHPLGVSLLQSAAFPINPHCGFSFTASQFGKSYLQKKVMCGPHTSFNPNYFSLALLASSLWISFTASQFGKSYVRKKVMCGSHMSFNPNYFSLTLLASSLWIFLHCFAVR